eukprot:13302149-Alexandrium_andersonii.AAC.1
MGPRQGPGSVPDSSMPPHGLARCGLVPDLVLPKSSEGGGTFGGTEVQGATAEVVWQELPRDAQQCMEQLGRKR